MIDSKIELNMPFQLMIGSLSIEKKTNVINAIYHLLNGLDNKTKISTMDIDLTNTKDRKEYIKVIKFLVENGVICVVDTNQYSFNPIFVNESPYMGSPFNNRAFPKMNEFADFMDNKVK